MVAESKQGYKFFKRLFDRADASNLAMFRILFGALMAYESIFGYMPKIADRYSSETFHFTYPGFEWVRPWPGVGTEVHLWLMAGAAAGICLGLCYRLSAVGFFLLYTHLFLIEKAAFNNHYYLICLIAFLFIASDAHNRFSVDRVLGRSSDNTVPYWQYFLFRMQFVIVYFYGGIAKINGDWLQAEPIRHWLKSRAEDGILPLFAGEEWFIYFVAYGGLIFDISIGWLLLWRKTRPPAVLLVLLFHLFNGYVFSIGVFPWLAIAATVLFLETDAISNALARVNVPPAGSIDPPGDLAAQNKLKHLALFVFVSVYLSVQILVPLRHLAYPGNVSWTEEGHMFAWHMKLRDKRGRLTYIVRDGASSTTMTIDDNDLEDRLSRKQLSRLRGDPLMIAQYGKELKREFIQKGMTEPRVHAISLVSLNGRPFQYMIDPKIDLGHLETNRIFADSWIVPLRSDLEPGGYSRFSPQNLPSRISAMEESD